MPFMPFSILGIWFRGLLSIAIIVGGIYLLNRWYDESQVVVTEPVSPTVAAPDVDGLPHDKVVTTTVPVRREFRFSPGLNWPTAYLASGIVLLAFAVIGRFILQGLSTLLGGSKPASAAGQASDEPRADRTGEVHWIKRPDGSEIRVECYGSANAPPIIMTHGWGCDSTVWFYPKKHLTDRYRLILWDEPGLGLSKKPDNNDYHLENLAADLAAVLAFAGDRPAILVGHSIGGMITLTLCKTSPELLKRSVAGLVLAHTSYTNPVRTAKGAAIYTALEKPVLIPLLYLMIALWPLVWAMNWLSYINGSAQRNTKKQSFGGTETRGQLDFCARFMPRGRPDVVARGMLGMIKYDATATLATIPVPTLVIVGDQDPVTLPEAGQYISQHVPNAQLETLSPAKHMGPVEHNSRFDQLVATFAESCLTTGVAI